MSINLSHDDVETLLGRYSSLINYQSEDPLSPIDPESYVDSNGDSLLHIAAQAGDLESVLLMISAGFDVNAMGDLDDTALHCAYKVGSTDMINALKAAGARTDVKNVFGRMPG